jgi:hypothetical protein
MKNASFVSKRESFVSVLLLGLVILVPLAVFVNTSYGSQNLAVASLSFDGSPVPSPHWLALSHDGSPVPSPHLMLTADGSPVPSPHRFSFSFDGSPVPSPHTSSSVLTADGSPVPSPHQP